MANPRSVRPKDEDEGSRKGEDPGSLPVASRDSGDRDFEMKMGGFQKRSLTGEVDEQSVAMAGLSVKFADDAENGVAPGRCVGRRSENGLRSRRFAGGIDAEKAACVVPNSPSGCNGGAETDEAEAEFICQLHTMARQGGRSRRRRWISGLFRPGT